PSASMLIRFFFMSCLCAHRALPPFPTRRSSDLATPVAVGATGRRGGLPLGLHLLEQLPARRLLDEPAADGHKRPEQQPGRPADLDRKSTRLNSSHVKISYAVFCLKKKNIIHEPV